MILVTGGTGLLGSYMLYTLSQNNQYIKALVRKNSPKNEVLNLFKIYDSENAQKLYDKIEWVESDLMDIYSLEEHLENIKHVYHLAASVSFDERKSNEIFRVNIEGTRNVVNACLNKNIEKFCFISSIAAIGPSVENNLITEENDWNYKNNFSSYSNSKHEAETEVWRASQEGLDIIILNPGIILGSSNFSRSGFIYDFANKNKAFYTSGKTGYVDAKDVANIALQLMISSEKNQRFIIISENLNYKQSIEILRKIFDKKPAKEVSDGLLKFLGFISRNLPIKDKLSKQAISALTSNDEYSNEKIVNLLHYEFIPIEESLIFHAKNYLKYLKYKSND